MTTSTHRISFITRELGNCGIFYFHRREILRVEVVIQTTIAFPPSWKSLNIPISTATFTYHHEETEDEDVAFDDKAGECLHAKSSSVLVCPCRNKGPHVSEHRSVSYVVVEMTETVCL